MTDRSTLAGLLDRLPHARVLVVGDLMLDRYVYGGVERISPEAPVPVLHVEDERAMLGGAGNVARNLAALGVEASFVAVTGKDAAGAEVARLCDALPGTRCELIEDPARATTIKTRYIAAGQQVLRADRESGHAVVGDVEAALARKAAAVMKDVGAVVLSDYGKGTLTAKAVSDIVAAAARAGVPVLVDPKGGDYGHYRGARLVTPNRKELALAAKLPTGTTEEIVSAARRIAKGCGIDGVLATRGPDGMTLVDGRRRPCHIAAQAREVFDVSGAGDTGIATVAAAAAAGIGLEDAARLANAAAGVVVGKRGTAVAGPHEIASALLRQDLTVGEAKLATHEETRERTAGWRKQGLKVGFTNGCFDLLHPGHIALLAQARAACDKLVVALNSDASVRRLKGADRPVQSEAARAAVLAALETVDLVTIFAEDTPLELIRTVHPDVLVKGADYTLDEVVGGDVVQSYGGRVVLAKLAEGHSTTATIARMGRGKKAR
jgi:D-beta-D-heptose 7-phosphate kinase/D-beta-D-heptose 1-phosphate adenosyltransferase